MYKLKYNSRTFEALKLCIQDGDQLSSAVDSTSFWILFKNRLVTRKKIKDYKKSLDKFKDMYYHNNMYVYSVTDLGHKVYKEVLEKKEKEMEENFCF